VDIVRIIAIDPGTHCGWAVRTETSAGISYDSGTWDLSAQRHEGGGMRFLRLRKYLGELLAAGADALFYEEVRGHRGVDAAHIYGACVGVISAECEARNMPYRGIPVGTIKKHATGKGNADKEAMLAAARARWAGWDGDDNEADARWIAETGAKEVGA